MCLHKQNNFPPFPFSASKSIAASRVLDAAIFICVLYIWADDAEDSFECNESLFTSPSLETIKLCTVGMYRNVRKKKTIKV